MCWGLGIRNDRENARRASLWHIIGCELIFLIGNKNKWERQNYLYRETKLSLSRSQYRKYAKKHHIGTGWTSDRCQLTYPRSTRTEILRSSLNPKSINQLCYKCISYRFTDCVIKTFYSFRNNNWINSDRGLSPGRGMRSNLPIVCVFYCHSKFVGHTT